MSVQDMLFTPALTFNEVILAAQSLATAAHMMGVADDNDSKGMTLRAELAPELLILTARMLEMVSPDLSPTDDHENITMFRIVSDVFMAACEVVYEERHDDGIS